MTTGTPRPVAPRWWRLLVRRVIPIAVAVLFLVLLVASLPLYPSLIVVVLALLPLLGLGLIWCVLVGVQVWKYRWDNGALIAPAVGLIMVAAIASGAMPRLGWEVSKGALTATAQSCAPTSDTQWRGVYPVRSVDRDDDGCLLYMDTTFLGPAGIAYRPEGVDRLGLPPGEGQIGYTEMPVGPTDGPWYQFEFGW
ncbi:hypothetical protein [Millisia brevis]|uniref:hypothetical protein n=1 Tax=Millisia brevis TaxID=264148 RepID=UPI0008325406|nr:hypothetical protein [Millisia brevis]